MSYTEKPGTCSKLKPLAELRDFRVDTYGGDITISGKVYNHPDKPDGTYIYCAVLKKDHNTIETEDMRYVLIQDWTEGYY